jgi:hypothetical protein
MKRTISVLVLVACSLFAALTLAHTNFRKHALTADGAPAPPWPKPPKPPNSLLADGAPAPPWPPTPKKVLTTNLMA